MDGGLHSVMEQELFFEAPRMPSQGVRGLDVENSRFFERDHLFEVERGSHNGVTDIGMGEEGKGKALIQKGTKEKPHTRRHEAP